MTPDSEIYSLSEPAAVDVSAIESELESLWREAAKGDATESVTRATSFNLVYATLATDDTKSDLLARLKLEHPARSILLLIGDAQAPAAHSAWVTAYCHKPHADAPQICSEFISLEVAGPSIANVSSVLLSLLVAGLPTVLVWDERLDIQHPLLMQFGHTAERVITSIMLPGAPLTSIPRFLSLRKLLGSSVAVSDLGWTALRESRYRTACIFDSSSTNVIREIHVPASNATAGDWLTACWLQSSLVKQHPVAIKSVTDGHVARILLDDGSSIAIPRSDTTPPLIELLSFELQIWSRDPLMENAFGALESNLPLLTTS